MLISFVRFTKLKYIGADFHWRLVPKRINATQRRLFLGLLASRLWFFMDRHSFARSNLPLDPAPGQHGQQDRQRRRGAKKLWHPATENCVFRLSFSTWNVCSMFNVPFKFELLQQTFQQYKVGVAGLQEVRMIGEGVQRSEHSTMVYSGHERKHVHGVAIVLDAVMARRWQEAGEQYFTYGPRVVAVRIPFEYVHQSRNRRHFSRSSALFIVCVYAPTEAAGPREAEDFYEHLMAALGHMQRADELVVLGDFNARVGCDAALGSVNWRPTRGPHSPGLLPNANGLRLLQFAMEHNLSLACTWFTARDERYRMTWQSHRSKKWHCIDHILIPSKWLRVVRKARACPFADGFTDHRMVIVRISLSLRRKQRNQGPVKCRSRDPPDQIERLSDTGIRAEFDRTMSSCCLQSSESSKDAEERFRAAFEEARKLLVAPSMRVAWSPSWFRQNSEVLTDAIRARDRAWCEYVNCAVSGDSGDPMCRVSYAHARASLSDKRHHLKRAVRQAYAKYIGGLTRDIIVSWDRRQNFWRYVERLKSVICRKPRFSLCNILKIDGSRCVGKQERDARVVEHFNGVFNVRRKFDLRVTDDLPKIAPFVEFDSLPSRQELDVALTQMSSGTAPGIDNICMEELKALDVGRDTLVHLFQIVWVNEDIPKQWIDAILVRIPKKGQLIDLNNWRGVSLLSVVGKVFARIVMNRLVAIAECVLPDSQCGFRPGRACKDMIHALNQLMEKHREFCKPLYICFIDLTKAYDCVPRELMWRVLDRYGVPPRMCTMIKRLHDGMKVFARVDGDLTEPFDVSNGLRQGCVLAPVLFDMFSCAMIDYWRRLLKERTTFEPIRLYSLLDGPFPAEGGCGHRLSGAVVNEFFEFQFADDAALVHDSEEGLRLMVDLFMEMAQAWGMKVSLDKTKIMAINPTTPLTPFVYGPTEHDTIKVVQEFVYLGTNLAVSCAADEAVKYRIEKARRVFASLWSPVFSRCNLPNLLRVTMYVACVWGTLLYGLETLSLTRQLERRLEVFNRECVRRMCAVSKRRRWLSHISHVTLCRRLRHPGIESVVAHLRVARMLWLKQLCAMPRDRLPRMLTYSICDGKRKPGRPCQRWSDCIRRDLRDEGYDPKAWTWYWDFEPCEPPSGFAVVWHLPK